MPEQEMLANQYEVCWVCGAHVNPVFLRTHLRVRHRLVWNARAQEWASLEKSAPQCPGAGTESRRASKKRALAKCPQCGAKVIASKLVAHLAKVHSTDGGGHAGTSAETTHATSSPEADSPKPRLINCLQCAALLPNKASLGSHLEAAHKMNLGWGASLRYDMIVCPRCMCVLARGEFESHLIREHSPKRKRVKRPLVIAAAQEMERCKLCGASVSVTFLNAHYEGMHGGLTTEQAARAAQSRFERSLLSGGLASGR
jgi:hypothetical protein